MVTPVVGFRAAARPVEQKIAMTGTLEANEWVEVKAEINGTVEEILFEEGRKVKQGDVLLQIDRRKLDAQMAEAEANLKLAEAGRRRYQALAETRAVSGQEVDQALAAFDAAQAAVALLKASLEDSVVTAPFDGVTGARLVSPGQFIAAGAPLTTVLSPDPMKAEFEVPERHLALLRDGQPVELAVAAYPEERFRGEVYFIAPQVGEETRTALVKAKVPNPEGKLRRGMFAHLDLIVGVREDSIVIPESALVLEMDKVSVFVVDEGGAAQPREVQPGTRLPGEVEIASGLSAGEVVVTEGTQKLRPGGKVQVRFEDAPL